MTQDNIILHNLSFEGPSTNVANDGGDALTGCISYINCTNAWMDHVTIRNFKHDDSITFGQSSVGNDAKDLTVSNCDIGGTAPGLGFGCITMYNQEEAIFPLYDGTRITCHNTRLASKDRALSNTGGMCEIANCLVEDNLLSIFTVKKNFPSDKRPQDVWTYTNANHIRDPMGAPRHVERAIFAKLEPDTIAGVIYIGIPSLYEDGYQYWTSNADPIFSAPPAHANTSVFSGFPNEYQMEYIPASAVEASIAANAGRRPVAYIAAGGGGEVPGLVETASFTITSGQDATTVVGAFIDSQFKIQDNGDATKQLAFEISQIGTGQTRSIVVPNLNVELKGYFKGTQAEYDALTPNGDTLHYIIN